MRLYAIQRSLARCQIPARHRPRRVGKIRIIAGIGLTLVITAILIGVLVPATRNKSTGDEYNSSGATSLRKAPDGQEQDDHEQAEHRHDDPPKERNVTADNAGAPSISPQPTSSVAPNDSPSVSPQPTTTAVPTPSTTETLMPTSSQSPSTSMVPTTAPSMKPVLLPGSPTTPSAESEEPSHSPSASPSERPPVTPSPTPGNGISTQPSNSPSANASAFPSMVSSFRPSASPTQVPSGNTSLPPSPQQSGEPAGGSSQTPSTSQSPSSVPSSAPVESAVPSTTTSLQPSLETTPPVATPSPQGLDCGLPDTCTTEVLETDAGGATCRDRIAFLIESSGLSEEEACRRIASVEFPEQCGPCFVSLTVSPSPSVNPSESPSASPVPTTSVVAPTPNGVSESGQVGQDIPYPITDNNSISISRDGSTVAIGQFGSPFDTQFSGQVDIVRYDDSVGTWSPLGNRIQSDLVDGRFGYSVSLNNDGTVVAIGDPDDGSLSSGFALVFKLADNEWNPYGQIDGGDNVDLFAGMTVALSADASVLVVAFQNTSRQPAPPNFVRVYNFDGTTWNQIGQDVFGKPSTVSDRLSVALSDDGVTFAIASTVPGTGYVEVYRFGGETWDVVGDVIPADESESIGLAVSLSGNGGRVAFGVRKFESPNLVRMYELQGTVWSQLGDSINTEGAVGANRITLSVSASGNRIAIGPQDDTAYSRVYAIIQDEGGARWSKIGPDLESSPLTTAGFQLQSVSLDGPGNRVAIFGASGENAQVYDVNALATLPDSELSASPPITEDPSWVRIGQDISWEEKSLDDKSLSLSRDGRTVAVGQFEPGLNIHFSGQVDIRRYDDSSSSWLPVGLTIRSNSTAGRFGYSVSLNGDGTVIAIGDADDDSSFNGRVMVYGLIGGTWRQLGQTISGADDPNLFTGRAVALSTDGLVLAVNFLNSSREPGPSNFVRVYRYNGDTWIQVGQDVFGKKSSVSDTFSLTLSDYGETLAISAVVPMFGYVEAYRWKGELWELQGDPVQPKPSESIGVSVVLSGDGARMAIGLRHLQSSNAVRVYEFRDATWTQLGTDVNTEGSIGAQRVTLSLSFDGDVLAVGPQDNTPHAKVYAFSKVDNSWSQIGADIEAYPLTSSSFQLQSVSLSGSGNQVAVFGTSGHAVQAYELSSVGESKVVPSNAPISPPTNFPVNLPKASPTDVPPVGGTRVYIKHPFP